MLQFIYCNLCRWYGEGTGIPDTFSGSGVDKHLHVYITQGIKESFQAVEGVEALVI